MSTTISDAQITAAEAESIVIDHPDFRYVGERSTTGYPYVVFERSLYIRPTERQVKEYRHNKQIVESHGGYMRLSEYEVGGPSPKFTAVDCLAMRAAVERDLPDWVIVETWNGEGSLSYSVAIKRR